MASRKTGFPTALPFRAKYNRTLCSPPVPMLSSGQQQLLCKENNGPNEYLGRLVPSCHSLHSTIPSTMPCISRRAHPSTKLGDAHRLRQSALGPLCRLLCLKKLFQQSGSGANTIKSALSALSSLSSLFFKVALQQPSLRDRLCLLVWNHSPYQHRHKPITTSFIHHRLFP